MALRSAEPKAVASWASVAWWVVLLLIHIVNMGYYVGFAAFYNGLYHTNLAFQFKTYSIGIAEEEYTGIAWTRVAVSKIHGCCIIQMVDYSLAARRLKFFPATSFKTTATRFTSRCSRLASATQVVAHTASRTAGSVFSRGGLLGVDSSYFDDILVLRELFETSLQSHQAYRMTQLLRRLGLIRVYKNRRIVSLLCDAVLDTVSSVGITVLIAASYVPQYTDPLFSFPFTNWFNDEWFTSVHQEFEMMLVVSWNDMAARLVFAMGLLQCANDIKGMLESTSADSLKQLSKKTKLSPIGVDQGPNTTTIRKDQTKACLPLLERLQRAKQFVLHKLGPRAFIVWGVAILTVHAYAESKGTDWPGKLALRPWLNSKPACSLVEINCYELGLPGRAVSLEAAWTLFDPSLTAHLTIRHCHELAIPTAIRQYSQLTSMKVYNSTIIAWPTSSAITTQAHEALRVLYFVRTVFANATLPPGLSTPDFPKTLRSFIASGTNLVSLPDDLHLSWPPFMSIALEASQFIAVPDVFTRLMPSLVSLAFNPVPTVPASLFENPALMTLLLCYTPIQELPRNVTNPGSRLFVVNLLGTNTSRRSGRGWIRRSRFLSASTCTYSASAAQLSALNASRSQRARTKFSASETVPMADLASVMDVSTAEKRAYSEEAVWCGLDMPSFFPLPLEDATSAMST